MPDSTYDILRISAHPDSEGWIFMQPNGLPWDVRVKVTEVDGVPQITALRLEPSDERLFHVVHDDGTTDMEYGSVDAADAVVTSDRLRRLPLKQISAAAAEVMAGDIHEARLAMIAADMEAWPQGRPRPDEHYQEVADLYRVALARGRPPVKAIQDRWTVGRAMASRYVAEARKRGLLDYPSRVGVAGTGSAKSPVKKKAAPKKARRTTKKKGR